MLRVGLTGGIACGKSRVLSRFVASGFVAVDLDELSRTVTAPGAPAHAEIAAAFGRGVLSADGTLDRKALGAVVFADGDARRRLNRIVHPRIWSEEVRLLAGLARDPESIVVTDGALLVEAGMHLRFDRLVVVHCASETQLARLRARDGLTAGEAASRIASQMPSEEKRRFAHFEVSTDGAPEETDRLVAGLVGELRGIAGVSPGSAPPLDRALGALVHGPRDGPRGLDPRKVLRQIRGSGGVELEELARLLAPPAVGPWYEVGSPTAPGPPPHSLAGPLALWALSRRGNDVPFLLAAAASVARLTHGGGPGAASACLAALAVSDVLRSGRLDRSLPGRLRASLAPAERWGGAPPEAGGVRGAVEAALRHPDDPGRARRACRETAGDEGLAGALVGAAVGAADEGTPPDLLDDVSALLLRRVR